MGVMSQLHARGCRTWRNPEPIRAGSRAGVGGAPLHPRKRWLWPTELSLEVVHFIQQIPEILGSDYLGMIPRHMLEHSEEISGRFLKQIEGVDRAGSDDRSTDQFS